MIPAGARSASQRVLVVTATVGSGHNSAANAIIAQLQAETPPIELEFLDVLRFTPRLFRAYYAGGFALAMSRFPSVYGLGYWLTNRPNKSSRNLVERRRLWDERLAMRQFARYVASHCCAGMVQPHFLAPPLVGWLMRRGEVTSRQFVVVTDIEVHRFWYSENVDHWFVPTDYSAGLLRNWSIEPNRITVSGIPIHSKWSKPLDRDRIFSDWRLPSDRPIVLLSGGTEFTCGPIVKIARRVVAASQGAYVVVLAGRNKKLLSQIAVLPEAPQRLIGVGFTDRVHELVEVCSLMVTKAGGITTAECLAKATPMVLLKPVPGHESGNAAYLQREGAAVTTRNVKDVAETVARLLREPGRVAHLAENARRLHRPGAQTVAEAIRQAVLSAPVDCPGRGEKS